MHVYALSARTSLPKVGAWPRMQHGITPVDLGSLATNVPEALEWLEGANTSNLRLALPCNAATGTTVRSACRRQHPAGSCRSGCTGSRSGSLLKPRLTFRRGREIRTLRTAPKPSCRTRIAEEHNLGMYLPLEKNVACRILFFVNRTSCCLPQLPQSVRGPGCKVPSFRKIWAVCPSYTSKDVVTLYRSLEGKHM